MMNSKPFFILAYHLFFTILSMGLVMLLKDQSTEMYTGAYYFNWIYFIAGGMLHYFFYVLLQPFYFSNIKKLLVIHFFICLLVMNALSFYLDSSWISWTFIKVWANYGFGTYPGQGKRRMSRKSIRSQKIVEHLLPIRMTGRHVLGAMEKGEILFPSF